MRVKARFTIPLLGRGERKKTPQTLAAQGKVNSSDVRQLVRAMDEHDRKHDAVVIKPQRQLGAPWIDTLVSLNRLVLLCEDCRKRYRFWYIKSNYIPKWNPPHITDCDGCSKTFVFCTPFYPATPTKVTKGLRSRTHAA